MRFLKGHTNRVYAMAFSPDGRHLLTGSGDETARLWDLDTGQEVARCHTERHLVYHALLVPNRDPVQALVGTGNRFWHWETATGRQTLWEPDGGVKSLAFQPDGEALVGVGGRGGEGVRRWRPGTWELLDNWHLGRQLTACLAISADGTQVATADEGGVLLWDASGKVAGTLVPAPGTGFGAFLGRSPLLMTATGMTLTVWDTATGMVLATHRHKGKAHQGVAVSPDSSLAVAASNTPEVRLHRLPDLNEQGLFDCKVGPVVAVVFSPDGRCCAAAGRSGKVVVWDVLTRPTEATEEP